MGGVGRAVDVSTNGVVRLVETRFNWFDCSRQEEELEHNINCSVQRSAFRQTTMIGEESSFNMSECSFLRQ